jgi:Mrp family chromosome partitioning ATPase
MFVHQTIVQPPPQQAVAQAVPQQQYGPTPYGPAPGSQPPPGYGGMPMPMPMRMGSQPGSLPPPPPGHVDPRRMGSGPQGAPYAPVPGPQAGAPYVPASGVGPPPVLLQGKPDSRLVLITEPDSARAASFRLLRDNLLAKGLPRVLAVSSAATKDGKTTCALNLALSLSERAKVLLVDGNLQEPDLGKVFCIPETTPIWPQNAPWLTPYRIIEFTRGLHVAALVVSRGQIIPRFEKQWFELLIGSLRRFNYDFLIIDAAALAVSPTVGQMCATADATLLAVRSGITTARALRRATEQLPEGKAIGLALVDAAPTT